MAEKTTTNGEKKGSRGIILVVLDKNISWLRTFSK